jgi:hypothetical protein
VPTGSALKVSRKRTSPRSTGNRTQVLASPGTSVEPVLAVAPRFSCTTQTRMPSFTHSSRTGPSAAERRWWTARTSSATWPGSCSGFLKSQHQLVAFTTSAFDCELPFRADDSGTAVASGDRVSAKDGRQNSIAWVLDLQQREWVSPPFDGSVETGMRLNGARARPDLGGPRLAGRRRRGRPSAGSPLCGAPARPFGPP